MTKQMARMAGVIGCLVAGAAFAAPNATKPDGDDLARFRQLAGTWTGTNGKGQPVEARYQVVAGGTAVLEEFRMADHDTMITMYHDDGGELMLTHYCIAGNQPRMRAAVASPDEVRFEYVDSTGTTEAGHMARALVRFQGPDRMTTEWTFRQGGKDQFTEVVTLTRSPENTASVHD